MPFLLYAVAPVGVTLGELRGISGEPLQVLSVGKVSAVAGEVKSLPAAGIAQLQAQDALVRELAKRSEALLPARFGTSERSAASLIARLEPAEDALARALEQVRGCEQMTLRVFADAPAREVKPPKKAGAGTQYLLRARERVSPPLPEIEKLRGKLKTLIRAERVKGAQQPPLRASVFHLIPRGTAAEYLALVEAQRRPEGVRWIATGPFPPYAFGPEELA